MPRANTQSLRLPARIRPWQRVSMPAKQSLDTSTIPMAFTVSCGRQRLDSLCLMSPVQPWAQRSRSLSTTPEPSPVPIPTAIHSVTTFCATPPESSRHSSRSLAARDTQATAINTGGQIAGWGNDSAGTYGRISEKRNRRDHRVFPRGRARHSTDRNQRRRIDCGLHIHDRMLRFGV